MVSVSVLLDPDDPVLADAARPGDGSARARLTRALAWAAVETPSALDDPVADLLLDRVLDHEGPFAAAAERGDPSALPPVLTAAAADDLRAVQTLCAPRVAASGAVEDARAAIKWTVAQRPDWGHAVGDLAAYFHQAGAGALGRARVFRWSDGLGPAVAPDPITLDDLVGYDNERALLGDNLAAFVAGLPANNALLYGERGTGKSSTVKALAAGYPMERLRLVEVSREQLWDFPAIAGHLAKRAGRFLVFVDDLSFEDGDHAGGAFAGLKSVLEGGVESQPPNVLINATSNRRHLVRELHADRRTGDTEVHVSDTFQEKLSLSDRFGLRVLFLAPDQELYLRICRQLAARRGLEVDDSEALRWCRRHNARSCRTARQFVDHLEGQARRTER